jgi:hypothetical protein
MIKRRKIIRVGHIAHMREECIQGFVGELEGKRQLGRPRPRWEDTIKTNLGAMGLVMCTGFIWLSIGTSDGLL